jgi:small subunit ribosomal protein S6
METVVKKKLYEAMFLIDSAQASDWDKVIATLETVLKKADSEIVSIRKWDDRKLAYEINGKARGTYILCYFRADGTKVREVEKAVQLSEQIMRVLILCAETMSKEDIEKDTPATRAEKQKAPQKPEEKFEAEQVGDKEHEKETVKSIE